MAPVPPAPVGFRGASVVLRGDRWAGDPDRQVLLLHGGGQTRHAWGGTAEALAAAGWTATALDLRGHGDSDWALDGHYGVDANVEDVRLVVEKIGPPVVLVGASLGGLTSLAVAGADPSVARALVLVDIVPRTNRAGVERIRDFMTAHLGGFASLEDVADAVAAYTGRPRRTDISGLRKNVRRREDGRWYWHWDPRMVPTQRDVDTVPPIKVDELLAGAATITAPTLIVRGGASDVVTGDGIEELRRAMPRAQVAEVPGTGHMVAGDDNDAFTHEVLRFLATV